MPYYFVRELPKTITYAGKEMPEIVPTGFKLKVHASTNADTVAQYSLKWPKGSYKALDNIGEKDTGKDR